ncbi:hypothetical protein BC830DRAFT_840509 [Chytriomyces sp. MP71]|nr:hypothetical protein BC830DRAFT_840509 [Chytriomyces sp. MP71]
MLGIDDLPHPPRIRIVGFSGSGKSTLGRSLAATLGIAHLEEDGIHFVGTDFQVDAPEAVRRKMAHFSAQHSATGFVCDGFWRDIHGVLLPQTNVIIELDYPFHCILWRLFKRTMWRCWSGEKLWGGETREYFTSTARLWEKDNIFGHFFRQYWDSKVRGNQDKALLRRRWVEEGWPEKSALVTDDQVWQGERILLRFTHPRETEDWLNGGK